MEYCQSNLPAAACISMNVMAYLPVLVTIVSSIFISRKKSFIFEMKCKQEFEENPSLIERSKFNKMVKQITAVINCLVSLVFLVIYAQEPTTSIVILAFYSIQVAQYIVFACLIHAEYKRQGSTSSILIANYVMNFLILGGMGAVILLEHTLDTHCFALLIILQSTSLVSMLCAIIMRNDFSKEANQLQDALFLTLRHKSTAITNNLLDQSEDQGSLMHAKDEYHNDFVPSTTYTMKKNAIQSLDTHSFKDFSIVDSSHNVSGSTDQNALKRRQSAQYTSSRSETGDVRDVMNNRLTPSFNHSAKQSTVSNYEEEPKTYLYAYRDIKVIGYKAKDNTMQFVIQYFRGVKQNKTYRSHKDFKHLSQKMSDELISTNLSLPQLPKRIQKTGTLDKKLLNDKVTKYNRFLYYIEYNKIESKEFSDFLLPNKELPNYAPLSEKKEGDIESFISSCSPSDSLAFNSQRDSIKLPEKSMTSTVPLSPSSFSRQRVSSDAHCRSKAATIYINQAESEGNKENEINAENVKVESSAKESNINCESSQPVVIIVEEVVQPAKSCEEDAKKESTNTSKESTLSTSTQASVQANRFRSQTTNTENGKTEKVGVILSSRRRQREESNQASFLTQSEQQSFDSAFGNDERQASALSEGQESASMIDHAATLSNSKTHMKRQSLYNSSSQIEANTNSTNKSSVFSFSQKGCIDQSSENIFFKPVSPQPAQAEQALIIIPQTKEIGGKTFYEIEFYQNSKKVHNIDKRYNNFKEFHLTMKSELKKSNQVSILPELPYKPSKSSQNLIEFRKTSLAKYLTSLSTNPVISNSSLYKKFIDQKN